MWWASADIPPPTISAYIFAPLAFACSYSSRIRAPAPSPNTNPFQTKQPTCTIKAIANHVDSKQKIRVVWNTKQITNYSFNTISRELSFSANLNEGNNFLIITAQNDFGSDTEKTTINYQKKVVVNPPDVIFEFPSSSVYNTDKESILVSGKIKHVTSINNAIATFNNKPAKYFNFNPGSSDFQATLTLVPGNNIFTVKGTNSSGSDTEQISIVYTPVECDNPAINLVQPQSNTVSTTNTKAFIITPATTATAKSSNTVIIVTKIITKASDLGT